jgi:hypothetical protein
MSTDKLFRLMAWLLQHVLLKAITVIKAKTNNTFYLQGINAAQETLLTYFLCKWLRLLKLCHIPPRIIPEQICAFNALFAAVFSSAGANGGNKKGECAHGWAAERERERQEHTVGLRRCAEFLL